MSTGRQTGRPLSCTASASTSLFLSISASTGCLPALLLCLYPAGVLILPLTTAEAEARCFNTHTTAYLLRGPATCTVKTCVIQLKKSWAIQKLFVDFYSGTWGTLHCPFKSRVGHRILFRTVRIVLLHSLKERNVLFSSFWRLMRPKRTMHSFAFFS